MEAILDFLTANQISVRTIDRTNGLVITDEMKLSWTYEAQKGSLEKPDAYTVVEKKVRPGNSMPIRPSLVTGIANFRLEEEAAGGKTKISVFLSNMKAKQTDNKTTIAGELILKIVSTGQFEKQFADFISK